MSASVTVTTVDKSVRVILNGGSGQPDEHIVVDAGANRSFYVHDDITLTIREIGDDDPHN